MQALTGGKTKFDVKLVQMVRLLRAGEPVKMSKRAGTFGTMRDLIDAVAKDTVRFGMQTRTNGAPTAFDYAPVPDKSRDNPM